MTAAMVVDDHESQSEFSRDLVIMVAKIAFIIFTIEALIMFMLSGWNPTHAVIVEGLIDSTSLTVIASPLIYLWVARPFANTARIASASLKNQLAERQRLLDQNEKLRQALQQFSEHSAQIHERVLEKIGTNLHDGPAQLLTFTLLKLNRLSDIIERAGDKRSVDDYRSLSEVLKQTLREVRDISTGLSLPELNSASITDAIHLAVHRHQEFTGCKVLVSCEGLPEHATLSQKICAYRIVQEGLSNAFKHTQDTTPVVTARHGSELEICVQDAGEGFNPDEVPDKSLGLNGMRARVQALGGRMEITSSADTGTRITAYLRIQP
jgi:signal transduction histidine kinase